MHRILGNLTYSNVVSTVCLVLLVGGGTAYAASELLPNGSVGTRQLQKEAVTPGKLSKKAKATLTGPAGPAGAIGATGPQGSQGPPGPAGRDGAAGQNLTAETPLASGRTETGPFAMSGTGSYLVATADFVQPLVAPLDEEHVFLLAHGETNAHCPGVGRAQPGYFCAYDEVEVHVSRDAVADPETGLGGADKDGAVIFYAVVSSGSDYAYGTWAVTAA